MNAGAGLRSNGVFGNHGSEGISPVTNRSGKAFERTVRIRRRAEFLVLRERGRSIAGRLCILRWLVPPPDGGRRISIVTSRRFSPRAVTRNRARRLLREAYRQLYREMPPAWVLLIPRRAIQEAKAGDVLQDLRNLCIRARLLNGTNSSGRGGC